MVLTQYLKRNLKRTAIIGAVCLAAVGILFSTPLVSAALFESLQIIPALVPSELAALSSDSSTAIVILSAGRRTYAPEFGAATVDELTLERLRYGAYLARNTKLPVLVSGGTPGSRRRIALAQLMVNTLNSDYGVAVRWTEPLSTNTAENAIFSSAILKQNGIHRIVLVTHAWHMNRARAAFVANGMTVIPAPTAFYRPENESFGSFLIPNMKSLRMSGYAIHELVGSAWYRVRYRY